MLHWNRFRRLEELFCIDNCSGYILFVQSYIIHKLCNAVRDILRSLRYTSPHEMIYNQDKSVFGHPLAQFKQLPF